jgi:DNA-binding PadR family transcriptional regulator
MSHKGAEIYTEHRNISRDIYEELKLSELCIEILCIVYVKKQQGYKLHPADIFNLTNYRYGGELYKQLKFLVKNEYLKENIEPRIKRAKKNYGITPKGLAIVERIKI